jgi:hypothetical protein
VRDSRVTQVNVWRKFLEKGIMPLSPPKNVVFLIIADLFGLSKFKQPVYG